MIGDEKLVKDLKNALDRNQAARIGTSRIGVLTKALMWVETLTLVA